MVTREKCKRQNFFINKCPTECAEIQKAVQGKIAWNRKTFCKKKSQKQEDEEKSSVKKLEEYTNNILTWGLWQTGEQVDFHLNTVIKSQKDKIEALKSQLNFRRFVLQQKISGDGFKTIYNVTKMEGRERVNLKPEELAEYVKTSSLIMRLLFQMTKILRRIKTIY